MASKKEEKGKGKDTGKDKGKAKAKEPEVSEELQQLRDVADDMNEVMGLDPAIDTKLEDEDELKEAIEEEAKQIEDSDKEDLKDETWDFLEEAGFLDHLKKAKGKDKGKKDDKKAAPAKKDGEKRAAPNRGPTNELGHLEGSQGDLIDTMLIAGKSTQEQIEKALIKKFDLDDGKAVARVKSHVKHLKDEKGCTIETDKKGIMTLELPKKSKK